LNVFASEWAPPSAVKDAMKTVMEKEAGTECSAEWNPQYFAAHQEPLILSIDVECVATGRSNKDRAVARVAMVDQYENIVFDRLVKPQVPIVSHLTQLTGIEEGSLEDADNLEVVREELLSVLPSNSILVGQGIKNDIDWLNLEASKHFISFVDIADFFKVRYPNGRCRYFSLRHEVLHLTGFEGAGTDIQSGAHDPILDALFSIRIFQRFSNAPEPELQIMRDMLNRMPATLPFWKTMPLIDNVQLGPDYFYKSR